MVLSFTMLCFFRNCTPANDKNKSEHQEREREREDQWL